MRSSRPDSWQELIGDSISTGQMQLVDPAIATKLQLAPPILEFASKWTTCKWSQNSVLCVPYVYAGLVDKWTVIDECIVLVEFVNDQQLP